MLRLIGLPTLDAMFISPRVPREVVGATVYRFSEIIGTTRVMVRSDGGREVGSYFRGGSSPILASAADAASMLASSGRAVMLLEPTDRFANLLSVNLRADVCGQFTVEVLGPGFDVGDLNRGGIMPELVLEVCNLDWDCYDRPRWHEYQTLLRAARDPSRLRQRLENVALHILPSLGVDPPAEMDPAEFAERWLRSSQHEALWSEVPLRVDLERLDHWFDDMFMVAKFTSAQRHWTSLVLSGSELTPGRFVYWDVVDSALKFRVTGS
jgi:hypothetical protein